MTKKNILHMISPQGNVSPFDVNMACDAGYDLVIPYTNVNLTDVKGLVQDAIFSRSINNAKKTGVFICGKDASLALDMMSTAKESMVPPFEISVFPDPAGSFTTAAAMVACTEKTLKHKFNTNLKDKNIIIYGGKGIVGGISAIMCAKEGSKCTIVGYDGITNVKKKAEEYKSRFGVDIIPADGKWIRKTFKTHSWKSTMMVVNSIGHLAESAWHHPDLQVSYAFVEVKLMNHSMKGITQLDFDLAEKIDEFILWNPKNENSSLEGTPTDPRFAYIKYNK